MKKNRLLLGVVLILLMLTVQFVCLGEAETAVVQDGTYAASIDPAQIICDDTDVFITATLYAPAYVTAEELDALHIGDVIEVDGEKLTVTSLESDEYSVLINGGYYAGGLTLCSIGDGLFVPVIENDDFLYVMVGTAVLPVSDQVIVVLEDEEDPDAPAVELDYDGLRSQVDNLQDQWFNRFDTELEISNGEIVRLERFWHP